MKRISFACNDPNNGAFAGEFCAVEFQGDDGDTLVSLTGEPTPIAQGLFHHSKGRYNALCVGRDDAQMYWVSGWHKWEGNWCWDSCGTTEVNARKLLNWLLDRGFNVEECQIDDNPFADILHTHNERREAGRKAS